MTVYFDKPTVVKQHGLTQECLFIECLRIDFASDKAIIVFGHNDFSVVSTEGLIKIE